MFVGTFGPKAYHILPPLASRLSVVVCRNSTLCRTIPIGAFLQSGSKTFPGNFRKSLKCCCTRSYSEAQKAAAQRFDARQAKNVKRLGFLLGFFIGAVPTGLFLWYLVRKARPSPKDSPVNSSAPTTAQCETRSGSKGSKREMFNFFADVVEEVTPAVVYIEVKDFQPMFGVLAMHNGSGFLVSSSGLVLTNAHVVNGSLNSTVAVRLLDKSTYSGKVIAIDLNSDMALVQLTTTSKTDLPFLRLGDSGSAKTGEFVMAVGSPFGEGFSNTVTTGVISNTKRSLGKMSHLRNKIEYLQTDAPIHQGNSGGPLVNLDGEVIGITSMQVVSGLSFAIPSNHAREFLEKHKADKPEKEDSGWFSKGKSALGLGSRRRRNLGVSLLELDPQVIMELRFRNPGFPDVKHGLLIHSVVINSVAHKNGLQPGDVVTHINGHEIHSGKEFLAMLNNNDLIEVTVDRGSVGSMKFEIQFD